jgi:hypothetical protein
VVIPEGITYLKIAATPFFWLAPYSQRSELSIEVLHDFVSQGAAKLANFSSPHCFLKVRLRGDWLPQLSKSVYCFVDVISKEKKWQVK